MLRLETLLCFAHLWNVDTGPEELQVLPHLLGFEFGVEDGQLSEHAHVGTLQPQGSLQHGDQLLKVTTVLEDMEEHNLRIFKHLQSTLIYQINLICC